MKMDSISSAETKHSTLLIHCCHHLPVPPKTPLPLPTDILPPPFPLNSTPDGLFKLYHLHHAFAQHPKWLPISLHVEAAVPVVVWMASSPSLPV